MRRNAQWKSFILPNFEIREDCGLRWQSAAATLLSARKQSFQSGVALRFPPQSKNLVEPAPDSFVVGLI
jgi:hypothetical protein